MSWEKAMEFYPNVEKMAITWCQRVNDPNPDQLRDDLIQDLMIHLVEKVDLSKANGPELNYVIGCLWKRASTITLRPSAVRYREMYSVEALLTEERGDEYTNEAERHRVNLMMHEDDWEDEDD
jgi:hypothetical protein